MKQIPVLHYEVSGNGPTVVLLHGYMASSRYWQRTTTSLAADHRVIAIDLLGFGKSPKPACSRYDYEAQLASINATLATLDVSEPFILVGHSMGALLALRFTRQYGERVEKLVLANMPIFLTRRQAKKEILGTNPFYKIGLQPGLHSIIWPIFRLSTLLRLIPERIGENAVARRSYMFQSTGISRLRSLRNVIFAGKIQADIQSLRVKTVILSGISDRAQYIQNLGHLPMNEFVRIRNVSGGHHLPITKPESITQFI
jgi:pimeloyl-ACP methyl ester carboxylesterase